MSFKSSRGQVLGTVQTEVAGLPRIPKVVSNDLAGVMLSVVLSALLAGCIVLQACTMAAAVSIKRSEYLPFDGAKLYLLIRGADRSAPVLLWLH
jgi:hypothetical protein